MSVGPTVLIVRFSALGDVILTTPVVRAVQSALPDANITFVTKEPYRELLGHQSTINRVVALQPGETVRHLAQRIGPGFDHAFDLQNSLRSRALRRHVTATWRSGSKPRLDRFRSIWLGQAASTTHMIDRHLATAAEIVGTGADNRPVLDYPDLGEGSLDLAPGRIVALAPGAAHRSKRWSTRHWFELAETISRSGWTPVMIGLRSDADDFDGIAAATAWHLSLSETVALLARCEAAVAHDSGLMHAAGAVGTPVVSIFGPTSSELGFRPMGGAHAIVEQTMPCHPCSSFGGHDCPAGHHRCMDAITPGEVHTALEQIA